MKISLILWRGSLLPLGSEAALKPGCRSPSGVPRSMVYDCCAAEREQAPSPQGCGLTRKSVAFEDLVHHPISFEGLFGDSGMLRIATDMRVHAEDVVPLNVFVMGDFQTDLFVGK